MAPLLEARAIGGREFAAIRKLAYDQFGLDLRPGKEVLVSARLAEQMRSGGFSTFQSYLDAVKSDRSGESLLRLIDRLTTNHTSFFRESSHFAIFREQVLRGFASLPKITIWCAASSTGEEPYTLAMAAAEELGAQASRRVEIFATDISTRVLEVARKAIYPAERLDGVPPELLRKYFLRGEGRCSGHYRVKDELRAMVKFSRVNLVRTLPAIGPFRAIFCRNVMIYFDHGTRLQLVDRLVAKLDHGGWLFVGHAESLNGMRKDLEYVQPAAYRWLGEKHGEGRHV